MRSRKGKKTTRIKQTFHSQKRKTRKQHVSNRSCLGASNLAGLQPMILGLRTLVPGACARGRILFSSDGSSLGSCSLSPHCRSPDAPSLPAAYHGTITGRALPLSCRSPDVSYLSNRRPCRIRQTRRRPAPSPLIDGVAVHCRCGARP